MTIKKRFLLSYVGGILIALISLIAIICVALYVTTGTIPTPGSLYRMLTKQRLLSKEEEVAYVSLRSIAKVEPDQFLPPQKQLTELLEQFEEESLGIVIRKDQEIIYFSKGLVEKSLTVHFPPFDKNNLETRGTIDNAGRLYRYVKFDFYYGDGTLGSILVLKKESNLFEFMTKWGTAIVVGILLISGLGLFFINYLQKKNIIAPLENLGEGMEKISEGQLTTFTIQADEKSVVEVRQLTVAFEKMQQALIQSMDEQKKLEQNRKELVANISHDLKTPITSIIGYVEGLLDGVADTPEKQKRYLQTIQTKSQALDHLIEELFLYSKLDAEALDFQFEKLHIKDFLVHITEELQLVDRQMVIKFAAQMTPNCYTLADRMHLNRVFNNLIENSSNYKQVQKPVIIELKVSETPQMIIIQVKDNGQGIAAKELPFVFDRFYRVEKSRTAVTGGSGLGLSIVKQIVEKHGGEVQIDSTMNVGTTVTIFLKKMEGEQLDGDQNA